jgi:uncharacterized protein YlzI (FlbEa/FlbD family)
MPAKKEAKIECVPDTYKWLRNGKLVAVMDERDDLEIQRIAEYDLEMISEQDAQELITILTSYLGVMKERKGK